MKLKIILTILLLPLVSCVNQIDYMQKPVGIVGANVVGYAKHFYMFNALGGTHAAESSAGTRYTGNLENSFEVGAQAIVARGLSLDATKVQLQKEVTARHLAGQITIREANALNAQIAMLKSSNELTAFIASLPK
jgi:hypothetical protein